MYARRAQKLALPPSAGPDPDFVAEIQTTAPNEVFTWTMASSGTYNGTIDYGDGSPIEDITSYNDPHFVHTYTDAGTYQVRMSGQFGGVAMDTLPDVSKILRILSLGIDLFNGTMLSAFRNSSSLVAVENGRYTNGISWQFAFSYVPGLKSFTAEAMSGNFRGAFRNAGDDLIFTVSDLSGGTECRDMFYNGANLLEFNVQLLPTARISYQQFMRNGGPIAAIPPSVSFNGSTFSTAWLDCRSLADFPANAFDTTTATAFNSAFNNCALTPQSVDNILVSVDTAGQSGGTLNMHGGTNAAPGAAGLAAKANLESRGWTVTTN